MTVKGAGSGVRWNWEQSEMKALKRPKGSDESLGFKHRYEYRFGWRIENTKPHCI